MDWKTQLLDYWPGPLISFDVPQWFISHKLLTQQWGTQSDKKNGGQREIKGGRAGNIDLSKWEMQVYVHFNNKMHSWRGKKHKL